MPVLYCAPGAPTLCLGTPEDWAALGLGIGAWGLLYLLKWLDPARKAVEQITGKPWWRN